MLDYTIDSENIYPAEAFMVVADDTEREWGKEDWSEKSAAYSEMGYTPVSMKNDFAQIYPESVKKAEEQYRRSDWVDDSETDSDTESEADQADLAA